MRYTDKTMRGAPHSGSRNLRYLARWLPASALGLLVVAALATPAFADRNNYYSYVDDAGVLHITNVRGKKGAWKLYRSLPGSGGGKARRPTAPGRRPRVALGSERLHRYDSILQGAARRYQLPESLLRAVVHTESNYYAHAVSRAGAMGLMQLMPATARYLGVSNAFDPRQNIFGGAKFLRLLANNFGGDMVLVLAAYNAGPGHVKKYGGVPPFTETRSYVKSVLRRYYAYERQAQLGTASLRRGPARHLNP